MNKIKSLVIVAAVLAVGSLAFVGCKSATCCSSKQPSASGSSAMQYTCGMHPEIVQSSPGKCPKCGMGLMEKQ